MRHFRIFHVFEKALEFGKEGNIFIQTLPTMKPITRMFLRVPIMEVLIVSLSQPS
jgi:hypothetical protein